MPSSGCLVRIDAGAEISNLSSWCLIGFGKMRFLAIRCASVEPWLEVELLEPMKSWSAPIMAKVRMMWYYIFKDRWLPNYCSIKTDHTMIPQHRNKIPRISYCCHSSNYPNWCKVQEFTVPEILGSVWRIWHPSIIRDILLWRSKCWSSCCCRAFWWSWSRNTLWSHSLYDALEEAVV